MKQKLSIAMSLAAILAMSLTSLALADNVQNDVSLEGADTTPPVILFFYSGQWGENGWYVSFGEASWYVVDDESPISSNSGCDPTQFFQNTAGITLTCSATSEGGTSSESVNVMIDAGTPTISASRSPAPNQYGWNNTDVTVTFTCDDDMSGINYCEGDHTLSYDGAGQSVNGRAVDWAWNMETLLVYPINIDKTPPTVSLVGGPVDGGTYYFGSVPAAPTCSASDALSGLDGSCSVSGYGTGVGSHTVTASATDKAGNSASASATYTVRGWTLHGFYKPVEMNKVVNTVTAGSTVLLKFEVFAGPAELTATSVVRSFVQTRITCDTNASIDKKDVTSLRYTAGQFIQSWQTPRQAGACYRMTMITQDGSSLVAFFKLK